MTDEIMALAKAMAAEGTSEIVVTVSETGNISANWSVGQSGYSFHFCIGLGGNQTEYQLPQNLGYFLTGDPQAKGEG